jgi:hypothetical protein
MPDKPRYFSTIPTNVVAFQFPADPEDAKHFITEVSQILIPAVDRHPFSSFAVTPHDNSIAIPKKGEGNVRFYPGDDSFAGEVLKEALLELPEEKEAEYDDKEELEAAAISLATASGQRWIDLSPGERESLRSSARATADNRRQSKPAWNSYLARSESVNSAWYSSPKSVQDTYCVQARALIYSSAQDEHLFYDDRIVELLSKSLFAKEKLGITRYAFPLPAHPET